MSPLSPTLSIALGLLLAAIGALSLLRRLPQPRHTHQHSPAHAQISGPHAHRDASPGASRSQRWLTVALSCLALFSGVLFAGHGLLALHMLHHASARQLGPALFVAGLGLVLGIRHSTDADHVVAISTIISRERGLANAALIGSMWGLGHTITIFIVGSLIILFGVVIPPRIGLGMEFSVALMLILLGVLNLTGVLARLTSRFTLPALHDAEPTSAAPDIAAPQASRRSRLGLFHLARPLAVGLVHGLAGSAAVALLVLSTIHNPLWATLYLLIFGAGTMLGMIGMTVAMAVPLAYAGSRSARISRFFRVASGVVSLCFGLFLVYHLGFVGGLFTSHPQWTPQ